MWSNLTGYDTDNVTVPLIVQYPVTPNWTLAIQNNNTYILPGKPTFEVKKKKAPRILD
jgi:hypothetical protein